MPDTSRSQVLDIVLEDAGHGSVLQSIATTLSSQAGLQRQRFAAHVRGGEPGDVAVVSEAFPVLPLALVRGHEDPADGGWPEEARGALDGLDRDLRDRGWEHTATGTRWWERVYTRG